MSLGFSGISMGWADVRYKSNGSLYIESPKKECAINNKPWTMQKIIWFAAVHSRAFFFILIYWQDSLNSFFFISLFWMLWVNAAITCYNLICNTFWELVWLEIAESSLAHTFKLICGQFAAELEIKPWNGTYLREKDNVHISAQIVYLTCMSSVNRAPGQPSLCATYNTQCLGSMYPVDSTS